MAINTFAPVWRPPTLVCCDFKALTARRYWPKVTGGFLTDEARLPANGQPFPNLSASIELFRKEGTTA